MLMPKVQKIENIANNLHCPVCLSISFVKKGKSPITKKQQYKCSNCNKLFIENPDKVSSKYYLPKNITPQEMFEYDIWDVKVLGKKPATNGQYTLKFIGINFNWLKLAAKKWIYYRAATNEMATLQRKLETIRDLSKNLESLSLSINPSDIDRKIIQDFIAYLFSKGNKRATSADQIGYLRQFLEDCQRFDWIDITKKTLIYEEDFPKRDKRLPRFIPDEIVSQINNNLDSLPKPIALIIKILQETGMRSIEIPILKLNCIRQDSTGGYWIDILQRKMKKEICICISPELAEDIFKQQEYIKGLFHNRFDHLFCQTKNHTWLRMYGSDKYKDLPKGLNYFEPINKCIDTRTIRGYLYWFGRKNNIKDTTGELFPIWRLHRFRHTHGTDLINAGVPQHIVQKRLGHASPEMTAVYAHIHDKTMRKEMEQFWDGRVVNNQGEVIVPENPDLDTAEMQWIKKNMKAQTLPDGFCGLPVTQSCPVQGSPCLTCSHLRTTMEFLDVHKKRLEETEKLIENARANGWDRQIETNLPIADNLKKIIRGLEQKEVIYGDESFPEQNGGEQSA